LAAVVFAACKSARALADIPQMIIECSPQPGVGGADSAQHGGVFLISGLVSGLRGRLRLAFSGISLFVFVGAAAGLYTLRKVGQTLDQIALETVLMTLDAQDLSRDGPKKSPLVGRRQMQRMGSRSSQCPVWHRAT